MDGPQVDLGPSVDTEKRDASPQAATLAASDGSRDSAQKRPAATEPGALPDQDGLFAGRARTISTNLGMLSLGSDSHQKHYLGSSSGLFFSDLIGASPSDQDLDDGTLGFIDEPSWNAPDGLLESTDNHLRAMINLLRQVSLIILLLPLLPWHSFHL